MSGERERGHAQLDGIEHNIGIHHADGAYYPPSIRKRGMFAPLCSTVFLIGPQCTFKLSYQLQYFDYIIAISFSDTMC